MRQNVKPRRAADAAITIVVALLVFGFAASAAPRAALAARHSAAPDFRLTDQRGHRFRMAEHDGHPRVLFFGYSHCGDVCPLTLTKLERAKTTLGAAARSLQVIFVTVDPHRDTPPVLRRFIRTFDPSFIALTGSDEELAHVYAAYHVMRHALAARGRSVDYEVEHSSLLYYIGRDGRFRGFGDWTDSAQIVGRDVSELIAVAPSGPPVTSGGFHSR